MLEMNYFPIMLNETRQKFGMQCALFNYVGFSECWQPWIILMYAQWRHRELGCYKSPIIRHLGLGRCTHTKYLIHHYNDVIMDAIASQITSLIIVYSMVYSGADQRKHQNSASLAFVRGIPAQMASNAMKVCIWWRHHVSGNIIIVRSDKSANYRVWPP